MVYILKGRRDQRAAHWRQMQSQVKTHEGELLTGVKGDKYQKKWSKKYLGRDLSAHRVTVDDVERYEKIGK